MALTFCNRHRNSTSAFCPFWCLFFVVLLGWQHLSLVRAVLQEGRRFERDKVGGRFEQENLDNREVVGDLQIFTRVDEAAGHAYSGIPDASLPHGREVRVSLDDVLVRRRDRWVGLNQPATENICVKSTGLALDYIDR